MDICCRIYGLLKESLALASRRSLGVPGFQLFDNLRPKDKSDLFRRAEKTEEQKLKPTDRQAAPLQNL